MAQLVELALRLHSASPDNFASTTLPSLMETLYKGN